MTNIPNCHLLELLKIRKSSHGVIIYVNYEAQNLLYKVLTKDTSVFIFNIIAIVSVAVVSEGKTNPNLNFP